MARRRTGIVIPRRRSGPVRRLAPVAMMLILLGACDGAAGGSDRASGTTIVAASSERTVRLSATTPTTQPSTSQPTTTQPATTRRPATTATVSTEAVTAPAAPVTSRTTADSSTTTPARPLEFVDGKFLGISQGVTLDDVVGILGIAPKPMSQVSLDPRVEACPGTPEPSIIQTGGLTLMFEGIPSQPTILTNWAYTGGPVAEFTELVAPGGIRIGDTRQAFVAAHPDAMDLVDEMQIAEAQLRFRFDEHDTIVTFGIVECVLGDSNEGDPPAQ
ncbi:MAG: hypothetical protein JWM12_3169 [Ilumatobacteraceae bacterium]|nr:hypothetical protein [Ilumatobacteraceae bacterium]